MINEHINKLFKEVRHEHNHPQVVVTMQADRVVAKMRKRAREETTPMNQIYDHVLQVSTCSLSDWSNDIYYADLKFC